MKRDVERNEENLFLRASENLALFLEQPYQIMNEFIETENFVPEAFVIHRFQSSHNAENSPVASMELLGSTHMDCRMEAWHLSPTDSLLTAPKDSGGNGDGDEDDEDWDEDDDDWDEDEDFDEDEEWDEDDEEWDEDEDWDEDDDEEGDDDWDKGEEEK